MLTLELVLVPMQEWRSNNFQINDVCTVRPIFVVMNLIEISAKVFPEKMKSIA